MLFEERNMIETINFTDKTFSIWIIFCIIVGIIMIKFLPNLLEFLNNFKRRNVAIPIAIFIWFIVYPVIRLLISSL